MTAASPAAALIQFLTEPDSRAVWATYSFDPPEG
jgi:hypothetical protein